MNPSPTETILIKNENVSYCINNVKITKDKDSLLVS